MTGSSILCVSKLIGTMAAREASGENKVNRYQVSRGERIPAKVNPCCMPPPIIRTANFEKIISGGQSLGAITSEENANDIGKKIHTSKT